MAIPIAIPDDDRSTGFANINWTLTQSHLAGYLNAANEVAVAAFLAGHIPFTRIALSVEAILQQGNHPPAPATLDDVLHIDQAARARARELLEVA